jgi:hypothetical protein
MGQDGELKEISNELSNLKLKRNRITDEIGLLEKR